jgi:uncharacterized membrane protein YdbT with pleckstrin-like domain
MSDEVPSWADLVPDETVEWSGRPHVFRAAPSVVAGVAVAAGAVAAAVATDLPAVVAAAALLGVVLVVAGLWPVVTVEYLVTDRALYAKRGRRARRVSTVDLDRVQDVSYRHSAVGGVLGYGSVVAEVAGGDDVTFADVPDARAASDLVGGLARDAADPIPGSVDQWQRVLAEARALRRTLEARR